MCVETCVKVSNKSDKKLISYSLRKLSSEERAGAIRARRANDGEGGVGVG